MNKKNILIIVGLFFGLVLFEAGARMAYGPPLASMDANYKEHYIDVFDDFFIIDKSHNRVINAHPWSHAISFPLRRSPQEKLVAIVGESVAYCTDTSYLQRSLDTVFPEWKWQIINAGMYGADIFSISRILKETLRFKPDMVIVMMGNNQSMVRNVSIFLYTPRIFRQSWTLRLITRLFLSTVDTIPRVTYQEWLKDYERQFPVVCKIAESAGVPTFICLLPRNKRCVSQAIWTPGKFPFWWFLSRDPWRVLHADPKGQKGITARAYELAGQTDKADAFIIQQGDSNPDIHQIMENAALRYPHVAVVPFSLRVDNRGLGFDFFMDFVHYWSPGYWLMSDEIFSVMHEHRNRLGLPNDDVRWRRYLAQRPNMAGISRAIRQEMVATTAEKIRIEAHNQGGEQYEIYIDSLRYLWKTQRSAVHKGMNAALAQPRTHKKQFSWRVLCLAEVLRQEKCYAAAAACLRKVASMNPEDPYLYFFRGLYYFDRGDESRADADFQVLSRMNKDFSWLTTKYLHELERTFGK